MNMMSEFHEAGRSEFALPAGAVLAIGDGVRLSNRIWTT